MRRRVLSYWLIRKQKVARFFIFIFCHTSFTRWVPGRRWWWWHGLVAAITRLLAHAHEKACKSRSVIVLITLVLALAKQLKCQTSNTTYRSCAPVMGWSPTACENSQPRWLSRGVQWNLSGYVCLSHKRMYAQTCCSTPHQNRKTS